MKTKMVKMPNDRQRAKVVLAVRDVVDEVDVGAVEDGKNPANPFVRKNALPPVHAVRRAMKTTWTMSMMMTIWQLTISI